MTASPPPPALDRRGFDSRQCGEHRTFRGDERADAEDVHHPGQIVGEEAEPVACGTYVVRFLEDFDCLGFFLPMGSLERVFPVGAYPIEDDDDLSWRVTVDDWLCRMAEHVFGSAPFRYALVGHEPSFELCVDPTINAAPDERWWGYLVPENGSLQWYPPNRGAPLSFPAS